MFRISNNHTIVFCLDPPSLAPPQQSGVHMAVKINRPQSLFAFGTHVDDIEAGTSRELVAWKQSHGAPVVVGVSRDYQLVYKNHHTSYLPLNVSLIIRFNLVTDPKYRQKITKNQGPSRDLNPGPLTPKARIIATRPHGRTLNFGFFEKPEAVVPKVT